MSSATAAPTASPTDDPEAPASWRRWVWWSLGILVLALAVLSVADSSSGVSHVPRLATSRHIVVPAFLGIENWELIFGLIFVVFAVGLLGYFGWVSWRQRRAHRALIVIAAVTILSALDPPANWVTYTVFNPRFLSFDPNWAYPKLAPLIEPLTNVPGYPMYYGTVGLVGAWLAGRYLRSRLGRRSRHPLWTVFGIGLLVGTIWDIPTELFMERAHMYFYSEFWGPTINWGYVHWPIVWGAFTWLSVALTTLLLYPAADGRSQVLSSLSDAIARRRNWPRRPSVTRELAIGVAIVALGYLFCFGFYGTLRVAHADKPHGQAWPYPSKVYDPYGDWRAAGMPGPFYR